MWRSTMSYQISYPISHPTYSISVYTEIGPNIDVHDIVNYTISCFTPSCSTRYRVSRHRVLHDIVFHAIVYYTISWFTPSCNNNNKKVFPSFKPPTGREQACHVKAGFEPRTLGTGAERATYCATAPVPSCNTLCRETRYCDSRHRVLHDIV